MSFAHPLIAVVGVLAIAVPIILHLLRRRRQPVPWGAMRFIIEAQRRTRQRLTIEQLLLLIARCVLVGAVGLALARPYLPGSGGLAGTRPTTLLLVVDNGILSGARSDEGITLDRLKDEAERLLDGLDPGAGDRASLILAASPAQPITVSPTSDIDLVRRLVRELEPASSASDLPDAIEAAVEGLSLASPEDAPRDVSAVGRSNDRTVLALLSGFRVGSANISSALTGVGVDEVVLSSPDTLEIDNLAITSVEPERRLSVAGDPTSPAVRVEVERFGPAPTEPVELIVESSADAESFTRVGMVELNLASAPPALTTVVPIDEGPTTTDAPPGAGQSILRARLRQTDGLALDNASSTLLDLRERLSVAIAGEGGAIERGVAADRLGPEGWLALALAPDASTGAGLDIEPVSARAIDLPRLSAFDAVLLTAPRAVTGEGWSALGSFLAEGGLLVVVPDADAAPQTWSEAFAQATGLPWVVSRQPVEGSGRLASTPTPGPLAQIATELEALAGGVSVSRRFTLDARGVGVTPLLAGDSPFLLASRPGGGDRGYVALLSTSLVLDWTDLPAQPLMVPLIQEMLREGAGRAQPPRSRIAGASGLPEGVDELRSGETVIRSGDVGVREAGVYVGARVGGQPAGLFIYNPVRADPTLTEAGLVQAWARGLGSEPRMLGDDAEASSDDSNTRPIALTLLLLAIGAAVVELIVAGRLASPTGTILPWGLPGLVTRLVGGGASQPSDAAGANP